MKARLPVGGLRISLFPASRSCSRRERCRVLGAGAHGADAGLRLSTAALRSEDGIRSTLPSHFGSPRCHAETRCRGLIWRLFRLTLPGLATPGLLGSAAVADTGPNNVSIPSVGGYQLCLDNIYGGDVFHYIHSVQGTRHPYKGAIYHDDNSVAGVSGQISDDGWYSWNEFTQPIGNVRRTRIDNQAATSGNGLYTCYSETA